MRGIIKASLFLLLASSILFLCACSFSGGTEAVYTLEKGGKSFTVDTENTTISDGTNVYHYTFSGDSSHYQINIVYPDGSSYWWQMNNGSGYGGWSDQYHENRFVSGEVLCEVVEAGMPKPASSKNFFLIILLLGLGIFNIVSPRTAWYLEYGWRYTDVQPSELALWLNRGAGLLLLFLCFIMIIV